MKNDKEKISQEEFSVSGEEVVKKVKELLKAGNARKIIIKNEKRETIVEFPLTIGVVGAVILPMLATVGALAALMTKCTFVVEKKIPPK